jgi:hypothetical protein
MAYSDHGLGDFNAAEPPSGWATPSIRGRAWAGAKARKILNTVADKASGNSLRQPCLEVTARQSHDMEQMSGSQLASVAPGYIGLQSRRIAHFIPKI